MDYYVVNPVLFIIFNRPEQTAKVFEAIRKARPERLYISADGPRENVSSDLDLSAACKDIVEHVDWECEVKKLYPETNKGSHTAIPDAIDWFFREEAQGIVLEDDCLPTDSFFRFCDELLGKYEDNEKVWWINGSNLGMTSIEIEADYCFSIYPISWGWASWRRAWSQFDRGMDSYTGNLNSITIDDFPKKSFIYKVFWRQLFNHAKKIRNWDYRWLYTCWINEGLSCTPSVNLIKNIGFGGNATHQSDKNHPLANIQLGNFSDDIKHPELIKITGEINNYFEKKLYKINAHSVIRTELSNSFPFIRKLKRTLINRNE